MKQKIHFLSILLLQLIFVPVNEAKASEYEDVQITVVKFLSYLKNGNTSDILNLIVDPMLSEREGLLRRNPNYPTILIEAYKKTDFQIVSVEKIDDMHYAVLVNHLIDYEIKKKTKFICQKSLVSWKISDEVRAIRSN